MTLEQLQFILEVERAGTIVAAAQNLNISHTTISRAISSLEDELGFVIFVRSRKGSVLTEKGKSAIALARSILDTAGQLRQLGQERERGALRIGAYPLGSIGFLQAAVSQFNSLYPDITILIDRRGVDDILSCVASHSLDFGLMFSLPELAEQIPSDVEITEIMQSSLMVVCSPASRLAGLDWVTPEDLQRESFALQREEQISYMMRRMFAAGAMPNIIMRTNDNELIKSTVRANNAVATYIEQFIANDPLVRSGQLVCVPLKMDGRPYKLRYLYARPAKKPVSAPERAFIRLLKRLAASG